MNQINFQIRTFAFLFQTAEWIAEQSIPEESPGKILYRRIGHLSFLTFALEGFLNHIGQRELDWWDEAERTLTPIAKIAIISDHLDIVWDKKTRPFQSIKHLISVRQHLVHGKTEVGKMDENDFGTLPLKIPTKWGTMVQDCNLQNIHDDVVAFADVFWRKLGLDNTESTKPFALSGRSVNRNSP